MSGWGVFEAGYRAGQERDWVSIGLVLAFLLLVALTVWAVRR